MRVQGLGFGAFPIPFSSPDSEAVELQKGSCSEPDVKCRKTSCIRC